ncbi:hypothetical protein L207DRAFT_559647 [Hyaloscypha variabilis F]|uniref:Uncharacterized protein n=1 Tax=Hyaloscypha variabilis (strain UAMH 11265 / GT02V1 / F) TaxID=1149755 RepID=A0A2J6QS36_HYAVF|nr:hypothetical protein L207DRAFT_559647 [Hyaloscypha variabilis F]
MTEQMGTPGSTADVSVNGSKSSAPKDKACPFCHQQFTSSSLGRHLDLYIKEKNPKPADGVHDVIEIRKIRGGITRRQPRNSTSRREDSTPAATPGPQERRSPRPESDGQGNRSPSLRRDDNGVVDTVNNRGKPNMFINKGTWESTGVMNNIPVPRSSDSRSWDGEDREIGRRAEPRSRSVSKQMLAKTTFEQKQKMIDALDNAKAAELGLRELLGSIRAAKQRIEGPSIFDYDPLSLDFPALTLHCLPPPPTLFQSTPVPSSNSWSILPPDERQYQALRAHFASEFQRWRISCQIATTAPRDDLSYPPPSSLFGLNFDDPSEQAQRAAEAASELEAKVSEHLHSVFAHWSSLGPSKRSEIWTLELARSIGRKSEENQKLKKEKEFAIQEIEHMKSQVDELSRLQHPREFKIVPPSTVPIDGEFMAHLGQLSTTANSIGFSPMDRSVHLDTAIERVISRWKVVVRGARGGGGLAGQRSLSGDSTSASLPPPLPSANSTTTPISSTNNPSTVQTPTINMTMDQPERTNSTLTDNTMDADAMGSDADADADMEEDDSFVEMSDAPQSTPATNFRLANGNASSNASGGNGNGGGQQANRISGMGEVVQGYVRIGA